jgi:hypothetical protein
VGRFEELLESIGSEKVRRVVRWLLEQAAPALEAEDCNCKLIVHSGPGNDVKTVIETHRKI